MRDGGGRRRHGGNGSMTMMAALRHLAVTALLAWAAMTAGPAQAATVTTGDMVTCSDIFPPFYICSPSTTATIGGGVEFTLSIFNAPALTFDFSDDLLTIRGIPPVVGLSSGFVFTFTNTASPFLSATLLSNTAVVPDDDNPYAASRISVAAGVLSVDLGETRVFGDGALTIALAAAPRDVQSVPEPATWALTILGFGVVGAILRRRRPRAACRLA